MASYASRVRTDAARWVELGFVDRKGADAIVADVAARDRRSLSFGSILAIMAALLFGAAILIFIAANWEAFPRLARVGALFAIIVAGYVGGAFLKMRDHSAFGEALWLIAAITFGGAIALIGQMYHFSGDETQAILIWCLGTAVAAAGLRSSPLTVMAVVLAGSWLFMEGVGFFRQTEVPLGFLVLAALLWLVSYWTQSAAARHLLLLSLVFYAALYAAETSVLPLASLLAAVSALVFAFAVFLPDLSERIARIDGLLPVHALIGFLTGILMVQIQIGDDSAQYFGLAAAIGLAGITAAIVLAGRESRGLRWIAYVGFAVQLCLIYGVMVQGMLGTAGFFLAAGLILAILAFVIIRIEKRMTASPRIEGSAA